MTHEKGDDISQIVERSINVSINFDQVCIWYGSAENKASIGFPQIYLKCLQFFKSMGYL